MKIKCIRCGKEIGSPNANNAKYVINPNDQRTWGEDMKEKIIKASLSEKRVQDILEEKTTEQREFIVDENGKVTKIIEHPFTMDDFLNSTEIYPDEYGRREVTIKEEIERPKTAIVCLDCVQEDDEIIW